MTCQLSDLLFLIYAFLVHPHRANYVFLQLGFQHLAYEKREDVPSYGLESLLGKSNTDIKKRIAMLTFIHDLGPPTLMLFQIVALSIVADGVFFQTENAIMVENVGTL